MKKRVAILRGNSLNRFEMQSYEPLLEKWDLVALHAKDNLFGLHGLKIPIRPIRTYTEFMKYIPSGLNKYANYVLINFFEILVPLRNPMNYLKGFDIIHTADPHYYFSYQAALAKKKYGSKLVITHWENIPFHSSRRKVSQKRKQITLNATDAFIAVTERAKETLLIDGVPENKIQVIPVGIDLERFRPFERDPGLSQSLGIQSDDLVILYVGRMVRSKGIFELLYAFWKLLNDRELGAYSLKLICVGSGDNKKIIEMIDRLGMKNQALLAGSFAYDALPKIHNLADVFVLPSLPTYHWREQLGIVLLESMACGKAVISTLSGSIPEVIGNAGKLVQPYDHLALYLALKQVLLDDSLRFELGRKARARTEICFDSRQIAAKIDEVYKTLLR